MLAFANLFTMLMASRNNHHTIVYSTQPPVDSKPPSSQAKGTKSTLFFTHKEQRALSTLGLRRWQTP